MFSVGLEAGVFWELEGADGDFEFGENGGELSLDEGELQGVFEIDAGSGPKLLVWERNHDGLFYAAVVPAVVPYGGFDLFRLDIFASRNEEVVFAADDFKLFSFPPSEIACLKPSLVIEGKVQVVVLEVALK